MVATLLGVPIFIMLGGATLLLFIAEDVPVAAIHQKRVLDEIAQAKRRLRLPETAPVVSCYEAGREGFLLHRFLAAHGITNHVVHGAFEHEFTNGQGERNRAK